MDDERFLPIWIGHPEAAAILMKLQGASPPRPMTHDLVTDIISELHGEVVRVTVTELRENTYYARITIVQNGREVEVDSRPSDAIALAVRRPLPAALEAWVLRCLEKDPDRRPRSAAEAQASLEACGLGGAWRGKDARVWWAGRGRAIAAARRGGVAPSAATASRPALEAAGEPAAGRS